MSLANINREIGSSRLNKQPNSRDCFICGVENIAGVHVHFYEMEGDSGEGEILARFRTQPIHQGYPGRVHGGVLTGILDETIGRAINFGAGVEVKEWGVTASLDLRFRLPVPLNEEILARGRITRMGRRMFEGSGEILLPDGQVAVTAVGKFIKLPLDEIAGDDPEDFGWKIYPDGEGEANP